jgi:hypothetical protein
MRFSISEPDPAPYDVNPEHEADQIRQDAFAGFVASMRDYAHGDGWEAVVAEVPEAMKYLRVCYAAFETSIQKELMDFAEGYGWPDTLRAIASAMQADEQARREAMDRR